MVGYEGKCVLSPNHEDQTALRHSGTSEDDLPAHLLRRAANDLARFNEGGGLRNTRARLGQRAVARRDQRLHTVTAAGGTDHGGGRYADKDDEGDDNAHIDGRLKPFAANFGA